MFNLFNLDRVVHASMIIITMKWKSKATSNGGSPCFAYMNKTYLLFFGNVIIDLFGGPIGYLLPGQWLSKDDEKSIGAFSKKVVPKSIVDDADEGNEGRSSKVLPKHLVRRCSMRSSLCSCLRPTLSLRQWTPRWGDVRSVNKSGSQTNQLKSIQISQ